MNSYRGRLLSTAITPMLVGVALVGGSHAYAGAKQLPTAKPHAEGVNVAQACNPCNPCGAAAAGINAACAIPRLVAANPGAAGGPVKLTPVEAKAAWDCMMPDLREAYAKSGNSLAVEFVEWPVYTTVAYLSGLHGNRYVQNYSNDKAYGQYEKAGVMPAETKVAKPSITVTNGGEVGVGPLFLMEKMREGFNPESGDWRYTMIMPDGAVYGTTNGDNTELVQFCADCHSAVAEDQDNLFFLPVEFRVGAF